jgi:ADP-heptose:LPS heptosyltransferase
LNLLLIRLRLIGDVVFTTPAIRALKRHLPDARLTYLVEPSAAPVVAGNPHLDEVMVVPAEKGWQRLKDARLAWNLRRRRFDVTIDFHGGPRAAWLTVASGAQMRIGYHTADRRWLYTHVIERPRFDRPAHSVENQWELLAPLGDAFGQPPDRLHDSVEMVEEPNAAGRVAEHLASLHVDLARPLIVMHVSANNLFRRWPASSFVALVSALVSADPARQVLLTSGPSEREAAAAIVAQVHQALAPSMSGRATVAPLDLGLSELRAVVARASLFIGGDSGPLHVAATTRTPIVGIYGPTLAVRSAPWRDPSIPTESVDVGQLPCRPCNQRICEPGDFRCLGWLTPADVLAAAERLLHGESGQRQVSGPASGGAAEPERPAYPLRYSVGSG